MEQVRLLLAIGLSFLVLFVWSVFFVERPPVDEQQTMRQTNSKPQPATDEKPEHMEVDSQKIAEIQKEAKEISKSQDDGKDIRQITVETPFYTTRLSSRGATFDSYILKQYRETVQTDSPNKQLIPPSFSRGNIFTALAAKSLNGMDQAYFSVSQPSDYIQAIDEAQQLDFHWIAEDGTLVTKSYTFDPKSYLIDLKIQIKNGTDRPLRDQFVVSVRKTIEENKGYGFTGPSALIDDNLEQVKTKKIEENNEYKGNIRWISIEDRYFMTSIIPETDINGTMKLEVEKDVVFNRLIHPLFEILPGSQQTFHYSLFMGPKSMNLLNSLGHDMGKALNFGFFNFIAKPCLWFMNQIHHVVPNYGIAIILLTIFTKILLWPLGNKSYKSMSEMKKLQPLMTEIREKYKDDKQQMNQELMALYKTYKVNPVGGCLPMILQIPVFFALYRMLYQAIELRHAPFFLWINDLSAPDRLLNFGFSIPFMQPPTGIPVLTIIMGATMILQQKMSPPPGDPTQAKMMMLMPVVFTFIFINFSSGLVLYWLTNNLLSIGQQYYVQKKTR